MVCKKIFAHKNYLKEFNYLCEMKTIYLSWHYTTHGVAYLKHILSQFYLIEKLPENLYFDKLQQDKLNEVFSKSRESGFLFDQVIYLTTPQESFDKLSSRRTDYKHTILKDRLVIDNNLVQVFEQILNDDKICYNLEGEIAFVKENFPEKYEVFENLIWRNIQHYPIVEQIKWLKKYSNLSNLYCGKFKEVELSITDLRNEKEIAEKLRRWLHQRFKNESNFKLIVNVSLGSNETQVVWHILAESGQLPANTRFIKTYDNKRDGYGKRFKPFTIQEIPTNLVSSIGSGFRLYEKTQAPSRSLVNKTMEFYLKSGFSILLIGERGIGKSRIVSSAKKTINIKNEFIEANCASFDDDSKAEAELFGFEKGAFTGASTNKKGLLETANNGILFLDEVHHLSKFVQAKLMKAIQTDIDNKISIRKMGSNKETKVECRLIFATNKTVKELQKLLLPDFYDRIVQHVVYIPPLRETVEDRIEDWKNVWRELKFGSNVPMDNDLLNWLNTLPLYGNYRDLQKIAMYYRVFTQFDEETKKMLNETSAFKYAKNEFEKYHSSAVQLDKEQFNFNINQTTKEMIADYLHELQNWAVNKFASRKKAVEHFHSLGDTVTEKTLNDWKNRKSVKNKS